MYRESNKCDMLLRLYNVYGGYIFFALQKNTSQVHQTSVIPFLKTKIFPLLAKGIKEDLKGWKEAIRYIY